MGVKARIDRQDGRPFIWGWDDESIYFVRDGESMDEQGKRIQDHPELLDAILKLCGDYFNEKGIE